MTKTILGWTTFVFSLVMLDAAVIAGAGWYGDHYINRQLFMSACAGLRWQENDVIRYCDGRYAAFLSLKSRNWRPVP